MSVSSVYGSTSTYWEEYLERLKKQQQQKNAETAESPAASGSGAFQSDLSPELILSELQGLRDDPEKLKARAAELAEETAEAAANSSDMRAQMLGELASDLANIAESGDLSIIEERLTQRPSGAAEISSMLMRARIEEESDDEDESVLDAIKALLAEIRESIEDEAESSETGAGSSLESLVSSFQTIKEAGESITSDGQESTETDASIESLISQIKSNLTDMLRARYGNMQTQYPSVSLSG